jgi:uncharacterized LabA/DUF88 family protein
MKTINTGNTALHIDFENIVKGYDGKTVKAFTIKGLLSEIESHNAVGRITIKKAYADWSKPNLGKLRFELQCEGITCIHVFGNDAKGTVKNLVDSNIVVDAIDDLHLHEDLQTFVIASGDGDFSPLVRRLQEYGKTVVGCSYKEQTSTVLKSVCDDFIFLEDRTWGGEKAQAKESTAPDGKDASERLDAKSAQQMREPKPEPPSPAPVPMVKISAPLAEPWTATLKRMQGDVPAINANAGGDAVLAKAREVLVWMTRDATAQSLLHNGYDISIFQNIIGKLIKGFDHKAIGFVKLGAFVKEAVIGTGLDVWTQGDCKGQKYCGWKIAYADSFRSGWQSAESVSSNDSILSIAGEVLPLQENLRQIA